MSTIPDVSPFTGSIPPYVPDIAQFISQLVSNPIERGFYLPDTIFHYTIDQLISTGTCDLFKFNATPVVVNYGEAIPIEIINAIRLARDPRIDRYEVIKKIRSISEYIHRWAIRDPQNILKEAELYPNSFGLFLLFGDTYLFPSGRARTSMSMFRSPINPIISVSNEDLEKIQKGDPIEIQKYGLSLQLAIPVSRYAPSIELGLYHEDEPEEEICGTFYYLEPDSSVLLSYNKRGIFFNKIYASLEMLRMLPGMPSMYNPFDDDILFDLYYDFFNQTEKKIAEDLSDTIISAFMHNDPFGKTISKYTTTIYPMYDPGRLFKDFLNFIEGDETLFWFDRQYKDKRTGQYIDLYATEDSFDQPLCFAANYFGYDILELTNMPGSTRAVSEILDTRSRDVSFASLIWIA